MPKTPRHITRLDSVSQDDTRIDTILSMRQNLSPDPHLRFRYRWPLVARQNQTPPDGLWTAWILLAGRGFGKTRTGAEWVRSLAESGRAGRIALVARTPAEIRDTMIQGQSGLLSICPPWAMPEYESTKRKAHLAQRSDCLPLLQLRTRPAQRPPVRRRMVRRACIMEVPSRHMGQPGVRAEARLRSTMCGHHHTQASRPAQGACRAPRRHSHKRHHLRQRGQPRSQLLLPHQVAVRGHPNRTTGDLRRPPRPVRRCTLAETVDRRR